MPLGICLDGSGFTENHKFMQTHFKKFYNIWVSSVFGNELLLGTQASKSNILCTHSWVSVLDPYPDVPPKMCICIVSLTRIPWIGESDGFV